MCCVFLAIKLLLDELYFSVTEDELKNCEKNVNTVRRLFEYLLEVLAGII